MSRRPILARARSTAGAPGRAGGRVASGGRSASGGQAMAASGPGRSREGAAGRPAGSQRPPSRARILSVRSLVLGVTLLVGFMIVFPTVRVYLGQQQRLAALSAEVTAAEQHEKDLQGELDRWGTGAYVAAQARERLGYVMPGETAYRVIDPETVAEAPAVRSTDPEAVSGAALPIGGSAAPWYSTIWDSVTLAGASEVQPSVGAAEGTTE